MKNEIVHLIIMGIQQLAKTILLNHVVTFQENRRLMPWGRHRKHSYDYILDRILFVLVTGCQWSRLEVENGSWKTIYHYFSLWSKANLFEKAYEDVLRVYRKIKGRTQEVIVDTSFIKNVFGTDCVGPSPFDRGRKATKVSTITDKYGIPLVFTFHRGNRNDSKILHHTLNKCKHDISGSTLYADKIYDTRECRDVLSSFDMENRISKKRQVVDKKDNKTRIAVEHTFSWLDKFRRIILRYEASVSRLRSFHYLAATCITGNRLILS